MLHGRQMLCTLAWHNAQSVRWNRTLSSELGMRPLMERVLSRREILGA